jgi:hypothetical protein
MSGSRKPRAKSPEPQWWEARLAHNRKPASYTCPLCGRKLPALSSHMLLFPEGDHSRRRHAHTDCVMNARRAGRLRTRDEWQAAQRQTTQSRNQTTTQSTTQSQPTDVQADDGGPTRPARRFSASMIRWALRPRLKRSRPSDS